MAFTAPPILNAEQPPKCKKEQKTFRFEVELNDEEDYEMSYLDLIEKHLGRQATVNGTPNGKPLVSPAPDGHNKSVVDDYVKQLDNYGPSVILKKGSKKRRLQVKDFCDMGYGYDLNDPFIDDTESYDAVLPPDVHAQEGGFYVNCGDIKTIIDNSSDIETWIVGGNTAAAATTSSDDSPESPKVQKPHFATPGKPKKRSKQLISKAVRQLSKPKAGAVPPGVNPDASGDSTSKTGTEAATNGSEKVPKKRGPYKTSSKKRLAESSPSASKATSPKKRALVTNFQSPTSHATSAPSGSNGVSEGGEATGAVPTTSQVPAVPAEESMMAIASSGTPSGSPNKMSPAQLQSIESTIDAVIRPVTPDLLPNVPEAVRATVKKLKEEAKSVNFDAKRFISSTSDELLIRLDGQLRACSASVRSNVFNHIAGNIPGSKKSFVRRIKKVKEDYEDRKVSTVLEQLKQVINNLTPGAMTRYETELKVYQEKLAVWKAAYDEYERLKNANIQASASVPDAAEGAKETGDKAPTSEGGAAAPTAGATAPVELGPAPRRPNQPRRVLPVPDQMRTLVTRAVLLRLQSYDNLGVKGVSEEDYLKKFIEDHLTPLWPKNWVTMAFLLKLSRTGVEKFRQWRAAVKQQNASERMALKAGAKPAKAEGGNENGLTSSEPSVAHTSQSGANSSGTTCGPMLESQPAKKNASSILGAAQVVPNEQPACTSPANAPEGVSPSCVLTVGLKAPVGAARPVAKPVPARGGKVSNLPASKRKISSLLKSSMVHESAMTSTSSTPTTVAAATLSAQLRQDQRAKLEKMTPQELHQMQQKLLGRSSLFETMSGIREKDGPPAAATFKQPSAALKGSAKVKSPPPKEGLLVQKPDAATNVTKSEAVEMQSQQQWQQQQQQLRIQQQQQQQQQKQVVSQLQQLFCDQAAKKGSSPKTTSPVGPGQTKVYRPSQASPEIQLHQIIAEELRSQRAQQQQPQHQQQQQKQQLQQQQQQQLQLQQQQQQQQQILLAQQQIRQEQLKKQQQQQQEAAKRSQAQEPASQQHHNQQSEALRKQQEQLYRQKHEQLRKLQEEQYKKQQEDHLRKQREEQLRKQREEQLRKQREEQLRKQREEQLRKQQEEQLRKQQEEQLRKQQEEQLRKQQEEQLRKEQEEQLRKQNEQILKQQREHQEQMRQQEEQMRQQQKQQQQQEQLRLQQLEQIRQHREEQIRQQQQQEHLRRKQQQQQQEEQLRQQQQQEHLRRKQQQEEQLRQQQEQLRLQQEQKRKQQQEQLRKQQELMRNQEEQLRQQQQLEQQYQQQFQQQERNRQQELLQQQLQQQTLQQQQLRQHHLQSLKQRSQMHPPAPHQPHLSGALASSTDRPVGHVRGKPQAGQASPGALPEVLLAAPGVPNPELTFGQLSEVDAESYLQMKGLHSKQKQQQAAMAARASVEGLRQASPIMSSHQGSSPNLRSPTLGPFGSNQHHLQQQGLPAQASYAADPAVSVPNWSGYPVLHSGPGPNDVSFANHVHPHSLSQTAVSAASTTYPRFHSTSPTGALPTTSHFPSSHHPPS